MKCECPLILETIRRKGEGELGAHQSVLYAISPATWPRAPLPLEMSEGSRREAPPGQLAESTIDHQVLRPNQLFRTTILELIRGRDHEFESFVHRQDRDEEVFQVSSRSQYCCGRLQAPIARELVANVMATALCLYGCHTRHGDCQDEPPRAAN